MAGGLQDDSDLLQVVRKTGLASVSQDFTEWQREQRELSGVKWFLRRQQSQRTEKTDKITGSVSTENIIHRQKNCFNFKKTGKRGFLRLGNKISTFFRSYAISSLLLHGLAGLVSK